MSTVTATTMLDQLKNLEGEIQVKNTELKTAIDAKEVLFKAVAQEMNEKLMQIKSEFIGETQKVSAEFESQIAELKKQRDDIELKLFGRVFSDTVVTIHDVYSMIQIAVINQLQGFSPASMESNAVQEAS